MELDLSTDGTPKSKQTGLWTAIAIVAVLPFVISYREVTSINGDVTSRDYIALAAGGALLLIAGLAIVWAERAARGRRIAPAAVAVALGAFQLLRGLGKV